MWEDVCGICRGIHTLTTKQQCYRRRRRSMGTHHEALNGLVLGHQHAGRLAAHLCAHNAMSATWPNCELGYWQCTSGQAWAPARSTPRSAPARPQRHVSDLAKVRAGLLGSAFLGRHGHQHARSLAAHLRRYSAMSATWLNNELCCWALRFWAGLGTSMPEALQRTCAPTLPWQHLAVASWAVGIVLTRPRHQHALNPTCTTSGSNLP